ncbi:4031_t:CDS:2, partial [Acaulospora colombiana]
FPIYLRSNTTQNVLPPPNPPQQQPSQQKAPTRHNFNTYKVVKDLEGCGFTRGQSEAIMRSLEALLNNGSRIRSLMLSKASLENESYLFKAALSDFRTEIQINRKKNMTEMNSEIVEIQREVSHLKQKLQEDIATMKNSVQLDLNTRKVNVREEQKKMEINIHELNNKITIACGDIRTEIEAIKWETTRMALSMFSDSDHSVMTLMCPLKIILFL